MNTTDKQPKEQSLLEVKKTADANLDLNKTTWMFMGFVLVFALLFVAFEWTATERKHSGEIVSAGILLEEEIMIPITMPEKKVVPPPPQAKQITEILEIVEDDAEIEESELASVEETGEVVEIADVGNVVVEDPVEEETIHQVVEQMPEYPGGMEELMKFLQRNVKYPKEAQEQGKQGRVIVQFVVNKDGSITDAKIVKSVDPQLDAEALRVVNAMPNWTPGKQRGKEVRTYFTIPVTFRLSN